tara:strand:+ start:112 stop:1236 length:1125 start_codon:yes stop_codon:yes gene_type:complete
MRDIEKLKQYKKIYNARPEVKEKKKKWSKLYNSRPEVKKKHIEYRIRHKLKYPEKFLPKIKTNNNCLWCKQETTKLYCGEKCEIRYKIYKKRFLPLFVWRFYSKYKVYKLIYEKIPKYINHGIKIPFKKLKNKIKRLPKIYTKINMYIKYNQFYFEKTKICGHWIFYKTKGTKRSVGFKRNFCSDKCQNIEEQRIIENKKQRNIASWGTEYRPDAETRKKITNKKNILYDKNRKKIDPAYRLIRRMRIRTKQVLNKKRVNPTRTNKISVYEKLCVKNGLELKLYIESLWKPGMNWENYGIEKTGWVIDHIIPLKHFINNYDLPNDFNAQKKAFGKNNLQPLWWIENATKSAKIDIKYNNSPIEGKNVGQSNNNT